MFEWQKGADIDTWSVSKDRFLWTAPLRAYVRHTSVSLQEEKLIHWWNEWTTAGETDKIEQILGNVLPYTSKHKEQWIYLLTSDEDNYLSNGLVSLFPIRRNTRNNVSIFLYLTKTIICRKRLCFIVPYTTKRKEQWIYLLIPDEDNYLSNGLMFHCSLYDETQGTMYLSSYTRRRQSSVESACVSLFLVFRRVSEYISLDLFCLIHWCKLERCCPQV